MKPFRSGGDALSWIKGNQIDNFNALQVGVFLVDSHDNLLRITMRDEEGCLCYGLFIDPNDVLKQRLGNDREFAIWADALDLNGPLFAAQPEMPSLVKGLGLVPMSIMRQERDQRHFFRRRGTVSLGAFDAVEIERMTDDENNIGGLALSSDSPQRPANAISVRWHYRRGGVETAQDFPFDPNSPESEGAAMANAKSLAMILGGMILQADQDLTQEYVFGPLKENADQAGAPYVVTLHSAGNVDHGQDPNRPVPGVLDGQVSVGSLKDASSVCRQFIADNYLGNGNWTGGLIKDVNGRAVAEISFNGSIRIGGYTSGNKHLFDRFVICDYKAFELMRSADVGRCQHEKELTYDDARGGVVVRMTPATVNHIKEFAADYKLIELTVLPPVATPKTYRHSILHLPSAEEPSADIFFMIPSGLTMEAAQKIADDVIISVNAEDNRAEEGCCDDGLSVQENIERRLETLGFKIPSVAMTITWDAYHGEPAAPGKPENETPMQSVEI